MKNCLNLKSGISLIAVLMFMLAATTASIVVFRYVGQENFSSAARLKNSEAYQASQAGLEAVQGWLTNKGADAGELIRLYESQATPKKPMLMCVGLDADGKCTTNLLGGMNSNRKQNFKVYLAGIDVSSPTYKLKFISEGEARDGSKYSQAGIFNVDGLHKTSIITPSRPGPPQKVPPYFGGATATQSTMESAYLIGNVTTTSGISTYGDLIVTGNYEMASGADIGCPIKPWSTADRYSPHDEQSSHDAYKRPDTYNMLVDTDPNYFGNAYIKENLTTQKAGYCGSLYVEGNMTVNGYVIVWGDLYVKGNLTLKQNLIVYGNVTIEGNITLDANGQQTRFWQNLVLPNRNSTYSSGGYKITVGGTTCKVGNNNPPVTNTPITNADCKSTKGGNPLNYLGDQISTAKTNSNGESCTTGSDCIYRIPDPIVLGAAADWKNSELPAVCTALKGLATANGNKTVPISVNLNATDFANAVNNCYTACSAAGSCNWKSGTDQTQWLVVRVTWNGGNNYGDAILNGNIIIVVEKFPPEKIELPYTKGKTNVLLYLVEGANTLEIKKVEQTNENACKEPESSNNYINNCKSRSYFIYSEDNITKIDGSQHLKGNLFMANGKQVGSMQDANIKANDPLFEALSKAGVIVENIYKCRGTGLDRGDGMCSDLEPPPPPSCEEGETCINSDPHHVPLTPHLKVVLQSQYANEENSVANNVANKLYTGPLAEPSILVLPRVIYVQKGSNVTEASFTQANSGYYSILYLNSAKRQSNTVETVTCAKTNCSSIPAVGTYEFKVSTNSPSCPNCETSFYVIATNPSGSASSNAASSGSGPSSNSNNNSSGSLSSSNSTNSSSSNTQANNSCPKPQTQVSNCNNYIGNLPASVPTCSYTACFYWPNTNKCYVCKMSSETSSNKCNSEWVWSGGAVESNLATGWWYQEVACPSGVASSNSNSSSSSSINVDCSISGTYTIPNGSSCVYVPTPQVSGCASPGKFVFQIDYVGSYAPSGWNNADIGTNGQFCSERNSAGNADPGRVWMTQATCNGNTINFDNGKLCGYITISKSTSNVTASCKLVNKNGSEVSSLTVTQGENIKSPKITCSDGTTASNPNFSTSGSVGLPKNAASNWFPNNGNAYYESTQDAGSYIIYASPTCGGTSFNGLTCGTITVQEPECSIPNGGPNFTVNTEIPVPETSCGNASKSSAKFNITNGGTGNPSSTLPSNWNNGNPHKFGNPYDNRLIRMYEIKCDDHTLYYGTSSDQNGIRCGSINIKAAATSSSSVAASSSSAAGTCTSTFTFNENTSTTNWVSLCGTGDIKLINNSASKTCKLNWYGVTTGASCGKVNNNDWYLSKDGSESGPNGNIVGKGTTITCPSSGTPKFKVESCW